MSKPSKKSSKKAAKVTKKTTKVAKKTTKVAKKVAKVTKKTSKPAKKTAKKTTKVAKKTSKPACAAKKPAKKATLVEGPPRYPTVHMQVPAAAAEEASLLLFRLGASGVEERDATTLDKSLDAGTTLLVAHFDDDDRAQIVAAAAPYPAAVVYIIGDDWKHRWREFFKPSRVGEHFIIRPSWEEATIGPDDHEIVIDPGQAFGTGTHPTTRLVLSLLEGRVAGGELVLDVGCGSGILGVGTLLLGAQHVTAIDIDDESMEATRENAERNGVLSRISVAKTPIGQVKGPRGEKQFPIVVANIESRVLFPLVDLISSRVAPGGLLILSGLLAPEEEEAKETYDPLAHETTVREGDWIAMVFRTRSA